MVEHPFGPPVTEVPLPRAPLALVVAQIRFPLDLRVDDETFVASFHDGMRGQYPVLRRAEEVRIEFGPAGPKPMAPQPVWRLSEPREDGWSVTASRNFVSLSTETYTSRGDFLTRFGRVLEAVQAWIAPLLADRFGVRYLCRITNDDHLRKLPALLQPEIAGALAIEMGAQEVRQRHQVVDALYDCGDRSTLHARWGLLPPNGTTDASVPPVEEASFVLDLDVATEGPRAYSAIEIHALARVFCERQYRFFRWAVTDEFLRTYGANP